MSKPRARAYPGHREAARALRLWVLAAAAFLFLPLALYASTQIAAFVIIAAGATWTL